MVTAVANGGVAVSTFATGILAARLLGPAGRGELAAIQNWGGFLGIIAGLGLADAMTFFSAREPDRAGRYAISATVLGLIACGPLLALCYFAMPVLLSAQTLRVVSAGRWFLLVAVFTLIVGIPSNSLKGLGEFVTWNALRIVISAVLVLALLVAWLSKHPSSVYVAMLDIVLLFAVAGPIYLYFSYRRIPGPFALDSTTWRPMLGFGLPCVLTTLPQTLNLRLDQMLMAGLLPANLLGLYVVAVAWSGMLTPVLSSVSLVFYPRLASYPTREEQSRAFVRVVRLAVPIAVVLALGLALITPWGLTLAFGKGFAASTRCSFILIGAAAILNVNLIIEEGFRGFGLPVSVLWAELGGLVVTGVALLLLLKPMGIEGAAIASVLGYGAVGILLLVRARVITGSSFAEMLLPKRSELRAEWARLRIALSI